MIIDLRTAAAAVALLIATSASGTAFAHKQGGILKTWDFDSPAIEDGARPVIFYPPGATCRYPHVKNLTVMVNSIYNGWRLEDAWLDK
jgi:hypothetical protein